MGIMSKPKTPKVDPEIERRRKEEEERAEAERQAEIQKGLRNETISSSSTSRNGLLSKGKKGFGSELRSLLGA